MKKVRKTAGRKISSSSRVQKAPKKRTSQKVLSAAAHLKKTTQKMIDDVFLKIVGAKVLARAQEMSVALQKEQKPRKKGSR